MTHSDKGIPSWIQILFYAVLALGGVYIIFTSLFLGCDSQAEMLRKSMGQKYVMAHIEKKPDRTPAAIAEGEKVYKEVCAACHGQNREGIVGPSLADNTWVHADSESALHKMVTKGFGPGELKIGQVPMPAKGGRPDLTDEQIWDVLFFLSSKNPSLKQE